MTQYERPADRAADRHTPAPRTPVPSSRAGILGLQRSMGNAAVLRMLQRSGHAYAQPSTQRQAQGEEQHRHGAGCGHQQDVQRSAAAPGGPQIQRLVYDSVDNGAAEELFLENEAQARAYYEGRGVPEEVVDRLAALAADDDQFLTQDQAMTMSRNAVTGAINVITPQEAHFLVGLAGDRMGGVSAYDPDMTGVAQGILDSISLRNGLAAGSVVANRDSITEFGHHRSHTDIFVPHPGPWVHLAPPHDLASCLEHVMGPSSHASVLTDNEPTQGFGQTLVNNIDAINAAHAGDPDYIPLTYTVTEENVQEGQPVDLGIRSTVSYNTVHRPEYRVIRVSRA
ncbi:hypothetical protein ACFY84_28065 [Streptomyces sp. NPDC012438]|uniref:hypothetical protein n=1 Tax=Streptomyces sp. NPDC012438 TaxID=3364833 RepID=UPI0036E866C7